MICNIVKYKNVISETKSHRIDPDFFSKELMEYDSNIQKFGYTKLGDIIELLTDYTANGSFASLANNVDVKEEKDFAKWIRIQNLDNNDYEKDIKYVDEKSYNFLKKSSLFGNELLISKTGEYLGKCYIFSPLKQEKYTLADNIFLIKLKNVNYNALIYSFINSDIGRKMLLRYSQGTGQPTIIKENIRELKIPKVNSEYITLLNQVIMKKINFQKEGKTFYNRANEVLNEAVLKNMSFSSNNYSIKRFNEIIDGACFRIDSEFYLEKYDQLDGLLSGNSIELGNIVKIFSSSDPGSEYYVSDEFDNSIPFIRIANLSINGISDNYIYVDKEKIIDKIKNKKENGLYPQAGEVLFSKDGTIGIAYRLNEDIEAYLCGGIVRLKSFNNNYDLDVLTLILNSDIVKMQIERYCGGSILSHLKIDQLKTFRIPILPEEIQMSISDLLKKSYESNKKSITISQYIKKAMDILIENGEEASLSYLRNNVECIN